MGITEAAFQTPHDNWIVVACRDDTSDWNTANAITKVGDEYGIPSGMTGWVLDVGAHIGVWTVAILADNPGLRAVCIEALPENVELIERNLERNGMRDRAVVLNAGASDRSEPVTVRYSTDEHHRFIGSAGGEGVALSLPGVTLGQALLIVEAGGDQTVAMMKIDCEGCEYPFLDSPYIASVERIVGELHFRHQRIRELLGGTHDVLFPELDRNPDFGPFEARLMAPAR